MIHLGLPLFPCRWNLWVKLTTADWVHSSCFAALTDYKGVSSHSPFFSVALVAWITLPPEWGNSWGSLVLTSSSLPTFLECLGKLEGRLLRLGLEHSLDGLLHRTRAIGGACCFLHKALFPHPIPSYTALESSYSWGCLLTCPLKKQQHFVENFCWTRLEKNYLLSGAASTEIGRHCQHRSAGYSRVAVVEVGTCAEKKILEIGSWDELTTTAECITQDSSWAIDR